MATATMKRPEVIKFEPKTWPHCPHFADALTDDFAHMACAEACLRELQEATEKLHNLFARHAEAESGRVLSTSDGPAVDEDEFAADVAALQVDIERQRRRTHVMFALAQRELPDPVAWSVEHEPVAARVFHRTVVMLTVKPEYRQRRPTTHEGLYHSTALNVVHLAGGGMLTVPLVADLTSANFDIPVTEADRPSIDNG